LGATLDVSCEPVDGGWRCRVEADAGSERTRHSVRVSRADLERWGGGGPVEELVRRSFEFLLEREPAGSILREFDLAVIQRYFPEFDQNFRR
jgi:hypothetical protein